MIQVGIIGGAGYTAGELIRILLNHPDVELSFVLSQSQTGKISKVHKDLEGETELEFSNSVPASHMDLIFICQGHGKSREFFNSNPIQNGTKYIDLSTDFRHKENSEFNAHQFVYGLSELYKEEIKKADFIANPGCFATAIELALLPFYDLQKPHSVHVNAITGSTGAGQTLSDKTHFSWRNNNVSIYKPFSHQHEKEIMETLGITVNGLGKQFFFIPVRGNFTRGIFASVYTHTLHDIEKVYTVYKDFYKDSPFVKVSESPVDLKQVVNTNKCLIHLEKHDDTLLITSVIDNLLKGASGQAVQNMNLMFGLEESAGLRLKSNYF
jgi:N-acetyl-gamma-glutamyl-phosphate reductase